MKTIGYINYWKNDNQINDRWFTKLIKENIDNDILEINYTQNPDILICSCFGNINNVDKVKSKIKIFFYGENLNRFPPYNNINLLKSKFDMIIGFIKTNKEHKLYRLPLWMMFYPYYNYKEEDNILKYIENEYNKNRKLKKEGCSLVSHHDRWGQRTKIYNEMIKYTKIYCPSTFKNNMPRIGEKWEDKINFIKQTIYNICPENSEYYEYYTEKIFNALEAGCIPIYWAIDRPEKDIIEEKCYCFVDIKKDISEKINHVINNREEYYLERIFKPEAGKVVSRYYYDIIEGIKERL